MDIKKALKTHGYTLSAVAKMLGVTHSALSQQISNKSMSIAKLEEVARLIDVSFVDLVNYEEGTTCKCPHCGKQIKIKISAEE